MSNSITSIGVGCFNECGNLSNVVLPNGLVSLENSTFGDCINLKSIVLPEGINSLGGGCFRGCASLESIIIPANVSSIDYNCFSDCSSLMSVTCKWNNLDSVVTSSDAFDGIFTDAVLYVPTGTTEMYKAAEPWSNFKYIIEDGGASGPTEKCETPTISYAGKRLTFASTTYGAEYHYSIADGDVTAEAYSQDGEVELAAAYEISAYASAVGYANSDVAAATLYFFDGGFDPTDIATVDGRRGILVSVDGGVVNVSGLSDGEHVMLYNLQGAAVSSARAVAAGVACLNAHGERGVMLLKVGSDAVKITVK